MLSKAQSICEALPLPTKTTLRLTSRRGNMPALACRRSGSAGMKMTTCDRAQPSEHRGWQCIKEQLHDVAPLGLVVPRYAGKSAVITATKSTEGGSIERAVNKEMQECRIPITKLECFHINHGRTSAVHLCAGCSAARRLGMLLFQTSVAKLHP
jgi:hypothetical protein